MPHLCILCPIENKPFTTSVEASVEHKASLPNIIKFSYCPYCNTIHGWNPTKHFSKMCTPRPTASRSRLPNSIPCRQHLKPWT